MSRPPRGLSPDEAALWQKLAATVKPLHRRAAVRPLTGPGASPLAASPVASATPAPPAKRIKGRVPPPLPPPPPAPAARRPLDSHGLDASWERKLAKASLAPDFTLDLHGHTLDTAHTRLDQGLTQAHAMGARLVLLITGRPRPADDHGHGDHNSRGERRGAIRAKVLDWLAAGTHASRIAAVRGAHPRHGGAGALYIVLKRTR
jgi:DNA-nicking Smr family endonuclease